MKIKYCIDDKPNIFIRFLLSFKKKEEVVYKLCGIIVHKYYVKELFNTIYVLERIK